MIIFSRLSMHPRDLLVGMQRDGMNDATSAFLAYRSYPSLERQRSGQYPTWNPYSMCGRPWVGNPQASAHYPINWCFHLFPAATTLSWLMVAHHLWGGIGLFFLCRTYGLRVEASSLGAIVFLGAPFLTAQTGEGHFNQICVAAWLPWALVAFERWRHCRPAGTLLLSCVLAVSTSLWSHPGGFLSGNHPQLLRLR